MRKSGLPLDLRVGGSAARSLSVAPVHYGKKGLYKGVYRDI